ncbi:MAG: LptF/LptG family permease [Nitrospinaceae bacterium]
MNTIHRYIFKELAKIFCVSVVFLSLSVFTEQILFLTKLVANRGISFGEMLMMMAFMFPAFLELTIPFAVLAASVIVFNQFSSDSEIIAMKTSGWGFLYLMRPVMVFSFSAYILINIIIFLIIPMGNQSFKGLIHDIIRNRAYFDIKPYVFNKDFKDLVLYIKGRESNTSLRDIFVSDKSDPDSSKIILAKKGIIIAEPSTLKIKIQFQNGTIHNITKQGRNYNILHFDRYERYLSLPSTEKLEREAVERNQDVSLKTLIGEIKRKKKLGLNTDREQVALSRKFSVPFSCLLFGLAGAALGIKSGRTGRSGGIIISGFIIASYFLGLMMIQKFGKYGLFNPYVSVWIPNLILMVFTFIIAYKVHLERPFTFLTKLWNFLITGYQFLSHFRKRQSLRQTDFQKPVKPLKSPNLGTRTIAQNFYPEK